MGQKPITANEMGRRGGATRARRYSKAQIRAWGKLGGRPYKLDKAALTKPSYAKCFANECQRGNLPRNWAFRRGRLSDT
jgi:hypothetical protein